MRGTRYYIAAVIAISLLAANTAAGLANAENAPRNPGKEAAGTYAAVPGQLLVKFKQGVARTLINSLNGVLDASVLDSSLGIDLVKVPQNSSVQEAADYYAASGLVEYAQPNFIRTISKVPNDPLFANQSYLDNVNDTDIDAPEAWDVRHDCSGVAVAVMDTGINYRHKDLSGNYLKVEGYDFANRDSDPLDDNGHGTAVAGIIGAAGNNGIGTAGVCWNVQLIALKIFDYRGAGSTSNMIDAAEYAIALKKEHGINIKAVNMSFGGGGFSQAEVDVLRALQAADILVLAAAGNQGADNDSTPEYPASYDVDNVVSVAATDYSDHLAYFSNHGAKSVDIAAPGQMILTSYIPGEESYQVESGTSVAAPQVAGVAAIVASENPGYSYKEIKDAILQGADRLPSLDGLVANSARLNASGAIHAGASLKIEIGGIDIAIPVNVYILEYAGKR